MIFHWLTKFCCFWQHLKAQNRVEGKKLKLLQEVAIRDANENVAPRVALKGVRHVFGTSNQGREWEKW